MSAANWLESSIAQGVSYNARMARSPLELSNVVLLVLAVAATGIAYWKDPSLPVLGAKTGFKLIWFILPRLVPALILAGMLQVLIPQEQVARYFGQKSGIRAIILASVAGLLTPRRRTVTEPLLVLLANSGIALVPLVAVLTS